MKKVAIFGNAGGGKSTLARRVAQKTGLPLYTIDKLQYRAGGAAVSHDQYLRVHSALLEQDEWILDGFGCIDSAWERFAAADTLIHVDLPLLTHCWWVSKRLLQGLYTNPEGWPEKSPILKSSLNSYRVLWPCHRRLTPAYRKVLREARGSKMVYHLRSPAAIRRFGSQVDTLTGEKSHSCPAQGGEPNAQAD